MTSYAQTTQLADHLGSKLLGFDNTNVYDKLKGFPVSLDDFGAVGDGATDDTIPLQAAINYAATFGGEVWCGAKCYATTATITLPKNVTLRGRGYGSATAMYNPGASRDMGTQIYKAHANTGISVVGSGAYSTSAGIYGIIVSSAGAFAGGDGFSIDQVGTYNIENCQAWSCGGNGFTIGVTTSDVTGHTFLRNCYVNNCVGRAYSVRAKWVILDRCLADGCTYGIYFDNAPECVIQNCHFEGWSVIGVRFANACTSSRFVGKNFIAATSPTALIGVQIDNVGGNGFIECSGLKITGPSATTAITFTAAPAAATAGTLTVAWAGVTGSYGIYFSDGSIKTVTLTNAATAVTWTGAVTATANAKALSNPTSTGINVVGSGGFAASAFRCEIAAFAVGISNNTTRFHAADNSIAVCGLGISSNGEDSRYMNNVFDTPTGAYDIDHVSGTTGLWAGNTIASSIKPTLSGTAGDFSSIRVRDNPGYKTRAYGGGNLTSGVGVNHGMSCAPTLVLGVPFVSGATTPLYSSAANATQFGLSWAGTSPLGITWETVAKCELV